MRLVGWTEDQIAIAKAYHEDMGGEALEPDLSGVMELKRFWRHRRLYAEPGEFDFQEPRKNASWAAEAVYCALASLRERL